MPVKSIIFRQDNNRRSAAIDRTCDQYGWSTPFWEAVEAMIASRSPHEINASLHRLRFVQKTDAASPRSERSTRVGKLGMVGLAQRVLWCGQRGPRLSRLGGSDERPPILRAATAESVRAFLLPSSFRIQTHRRR